MDRWGDHSLICNTDANPHRTRWHDSVMSVFTAMLRAASISVRSDQNASLRNTVRSAPTNKRPDLALYNTDPNHADTFVDINTHHKDITSQGDRFVPVMLEDRGFLSEGGHDLF